MFERLLSIQGHIFHIFLLFAVLHVGEAGGAIPLSDRRLLQTNTAIMDPALVVQYNVRETQPQGSIICVSTQLHFNRLQRQSKDHNYKSKLTEPSPQPAISPHEPP